ncbi:(deoxy)nucleoside triphosphate pyrophosphohydrolase [Jatrophihabitans sp.]|uniref:(deoxy)nucleoside triphosphate pyrophosphohydrolase n=1 Tax=Jatrophihabitans sp. TaxID=1932789 RepID=UPI0030C70D6C|nr:mismatch repair protein MutT [Jatrophihabitans sp.]
MRVVVGAVLIRDGRVLAARRSAPPDLAGLWEFPGGKVEDGETPEQALVRECGEELGIAVGVGAEVARVVDTIELRLLSTQLLDGEPSPLQDHDELRWLDASGLDDVAWLPLDLRLLEHVRRLLVWAG